MSRTSGTVNERQTPADTAMRQEPAGMSGSAGQLDKATQLKVAIVHDWLIGGGAEQVVLALHEMYPDAPIYTSYCSPQWRTKLDGKVITGYLQYWPFSVLRKFVPLLRLWWFRGLDLSGYDVVISSTGNGEAKQIRVPKGTKHICYCHSPTHFYWRHYDQYLHSPGFGFFNPLARLGLKLLVGPLRKKDYGAAQRVDYFIANSAHIQADIKQFYGRDSVVIHPPVDIARFEKVSSKERRGFVTVGRQTGYKHTDILVQACTKLNVPLTVVGRGPEHENLVRLAGPTITFDTNATDEEVAYYMASAEAFLFAAEEDFGITPVEAMAAGTPLIAYKAGGALDYVVEGETGLFFSEQTAESVAGALQKFDASHFDTKKIQAKAAEFSPDAFTQKILHIA